MPRTDARRPSLRLAAAGLFAPRSDGRKVLAMVTSSWLNLLLFCLPAGITTGVMGLSPTAVFVLVSILMGGSSLY